MVLLTSSAVSVAVSSGVICLFTFLLFLSGYILQQRSVQALQLALHPPAHSTPTLPTYFQEIRDQQQTGEDDSTQIKPEEESEEQHDAETTVGQDTSSGSADQAVLAQAQDQPETAANIAEAKQEEAQVPPIAGFGNSEEENSNPHLFDNVTIILPLASPSDICSALLFYRTISQSSSSELKLQRKIFYPSFWKEVSEPTPHTSALHLLNQAREDLGLESHTITVPLEYQTSTTSMTRYMQESILSSREIHDLDRAIYIPIPGLILDAAALVEAFSTPVADNWIEAPTVTPTASSISNTILLLSGSSAFTPAKHNLVVQAMLSSSDENMDEVSLEASTAREAAYLMFNEDMLKHEESSAWYSTFVEQYQNETEEVCQGLELELELDSKEEEGNPRRELRKRTGKREGVSEEG